MIPGQSAGIAASIAAQEQNTVQKLPSAKLRERLLTQGQALVLPRRHQTTDAINSKKLPGLLLDDASATLRGIWNHSTRFRPYVGHGYGKPNALTIVRLLQSFVSPRRGLATIDSSWRTHLRNARLARAGNSHKRNASRRTHGGFRRRHCHLANRFAPLVG